MLESLEQSNIKRMNVEKPETTESWFDIKAILTLEVRQRLLEDAEHSRFNMEMFAHNVARMSQLGISFFLDSQSQDRILKIFAQRKKSLEKNETSSAGNLLRLAYDMNDLSLPFEINIEEQKKIQQSIVHDFNNEPLVRNDPYAFWSLYAHDFAKFNKLGLKWSGWDSEKRSIFGKITEHLGRLREKKDWDKFGITAASAKELGIDFELTDEDKFNMQQEAQILCEASIKTNVSHWDSVLDLTSAMQGLAGGPITEKESDPKISSIPEQKQF